MIIIPDIHGRSFWKDAVKGHENEKIIFHERSKDCIVLNFRLLINQNAKNDIAGTAILV